MIPIPMVPEGSRGFSTVLIYHSLSQCPSQTLRECAAEVTDLSPERRGRVASERRNDAARKPRKPPGQGGAYANASTDRKSSKACCEVRVRRTQLTRGNSRPRPAPTLRRRNSSGGVVGQTDLSRRRIRPCVRHAHAASASERWGSHGRTPPTLQHCAANTQLLLHVWHRLRNPLPACPPTVTS